MRRELLAVCLIVLMIAACSEIGSAQTWRSYPKTTGRGELAIDGDFLWCAGEVLYRCDTVSGTWRLFGRDDGLPENALNCIAVDSVGNKWLGTQDRGLWSFDGSEFRPFEMEIPSVPDSVSVLMIDPNDRVWFAKELTKALWVSDGQMTWFYDENSGLKGRVRSVTWGPGDTAWCATGEGVYRLDGDVWTEMKTGDCRVVFSERSGEVWAVSAVTAYYEVSRFEGDVWTTYPGLSGALFSYIPTGFSEGPDGMVWVAINDGLARFDGSEWTKYRVGEGIPSEWPEIRSLASTAVDDNNVVYGSCNLGIVRYDGQEWSILAPLSTVPVNYLTAACWGSNRLSWGTYRYGLGEFDGLNWHIESGEINAVAEVDAMLFDPGRDMTWYGGLGSPGFGCMGPGAGDYTGGTDPNCPKGGQCMTIDGQNRLWVGFGGRICCWDDSTWTEYTKEDGLMDVGIGGRMIGIAAAHDGSIWAVAKCRIASQTLTTNVFENGAWTIKSFDEVPGYAADITCDALGGIWCLVQQVYGNYKVVRLSLDGVVSQWDVEGGYGLEKICVSGSLNGIWLVGEYGALRLVGDEWRLVTPADGLACGSVYDVAFAPHNTTWFCTGTSLCRLDESTIPWPRLYAAGASDGAQGFAPGDTLDAQAELHNPMTDCFVSVYVAVRMPNDPTLYFWPSFSTDVEPAFTGALPSRLFLGPTRLFTYSFSGAEPVGTYSIMSAVFSTETGEMIGEIEQVDFEFGLGQPQ